MAFFAELARAGFRAEPIFLAAGGDRVVDLHAADRFFRATHRPAPLPDRLAAR